MEFRQGFLLVNMDVWIDDISLDFIREDANQVAAEAIQGHTVIERLLDTAGLDVPVDKAGYLASSAQVRRCL